MPKEDRLFSRLKNHFYSLYEIDQELSAAQSTKKVSIFNDEYDYLESLKSRQTDQITKIKDLLNENKHSESS